LFLKFKLSFNAFKRLRSVNVTSVLLSWNNLKETSEHLIIMMKLQMLNDWKLLCTLIDFRVTLNFVS